VDALHEGSHRADHLERDGEPLLERRLRARCVRPAHPLDDLGRDGDAGHLVGEELGASQGREGPHASDDGRAMSRRELEEGPELADVEDGLRDREVGAGFELVREPLELPPLVLGAFVDRDALHESRGCADGGTTRVEAAVQALDHVREADRVDVEHLGGVRVGPERRRVTAHDEDVAEPQRGGAEQLRQHAQHVLAAACVVNDGLEAHLALDDRSRRERAHADPRAGGVDEAHGVDAGGRELTSGGYDLGRVPAVRGKDLDGDDLLDPGELGAPGRALGEGDGLRRRRPGASAVAPLAGPRACPATPGCPGGSGCSAGLAGLRSLDLVDYGTQRGHVVRRRAAAAAEEAHADVDHAARVLGHVLGARQVDLPVSHGPG
jgi:hypothetical protein